MVDIDIVMPVRLTHRKPSDKVWGEAYLLMGPGKGKYLAGMTQPQTDEYKTVVTDLMTEITHGRIKTKFAAVKWLTDNRK